MTRRKETTIGERIFFKVMSWVFGIITGLLAAGVIAGHRHHIVTAFIMLLFAVLMYQHSQQRDTTKNT